MCGAQSRALEGKANGNKGACHAEEPASTEEGAWLRRADFLNTTVGNSFPNEEESLAGEAPSMQQSSASWQEPLSTVLNNTSVQSDTQLCLPKHLGGGVIKGRLSM